MTLVMRAEGRSILGVIVTSRSDSPYGATLYRGHLYGGVVRLDVTRTDPQAGRPGEWSCAATVALGARAGSRLWIVRAETWGDLVYRARERHERVLSAELDRARARERYERLRAETLPAPAWDQASVPTIPAPAPTGLEHAVQRYLDAASATLECAEISRRMA